MDKIRAEDLNDDGVVALASAIVINAMNEYRLTKKENILQEIRDFFESDWCYILSCGADSKKLIERAEELREEWQRNEETNK